MSTPTPFLLPIDIMNRALQRCGSDSRLVTLTDTTKACDEVTFCYDKVRIAELRRNPWRYAIRTTALRPLDTGVLRLAPATWDVLNTYVPGSLVKLNNVIYFSVTKNVGLSPDISPDDWERYFGPMVVTPYDSTLQYYPGELVYTPTTIDYSIYMALMQSSDDPTDIADWDATVTYNIGDTATGSDLVVYQSKTDLNIDNDPAGGLDIDNWELVVSTQPDSRQGGAWLKLDATVLSVPIIYPVGAGPSSQGGTSNVYVLPNGFIRTVAQDPKAGALTFLGGPGNNQYSDFQFQGNYLLTQQNGVLLLRFIADIADVKLMDSMFCEGLACRIALEVCEPLTNSRGKLSDIAAMYKNFMGEARAIDGIERGPTEPPEDEFVSVRR
jgi:hypothetical protein